MRSFAVAMGLVLLFCGCAKKQDSLAKASFSAASLNPDRLPPGPYTQEALSIPTTINDPYYSLTASWSSPPIPYLWSFLDLGVFPLYGQLSLPPNELVVAVIDTGVDKDHPDLAGRLWVNPKEGSGNNFQNGVDDDGDGYVDDFIGWDFVNDTNNPADDNGHGSHLAGTIAAIGDNALGIVGVAPWVRIMPLKVCDDQGYCDASNIRAAIQYAAAHGAKLINLSVGGSSTSDDAAAFETTINDATHAGALVFVAAGNSATDIATTTPANVTNAVAVAAHRNDSQICTFSNYGWKIALSAPGCGSRNGAQVAGILSLNSKKCGSAGSDYCASLNTVDNDYVLKAGTSMATPHAVGLAAVAWTASPDATPLQIRQALLRTARSSAPNQRSLLFGAGRAYGTNLIQEARTAPGVKITAPFYGSASTSPAIGVRIEARDLPVEWQLSYMPAPSTLTLDLTQGTPIGATTTVPAGSSVDSTVNWTAPAKGSYIVILEATAGGETYFDIDLVNQL